MDAFDVYGRMDSRLERLRQRDEAQRAEEEAERERRREFNRRYPVYHPGLCTSQPAEVAAKLRSRLYHDDHERVQLEERRAYQDAVLEALRQLTETSDDTHMLAAVTQLKVAAAAQVDRDVARTAEQQAGLLQQLHRAAGTKPGAAGSELVDRVKALMVFAECVGFCSHPGRRAPDLPKRTRVTVCMREGYQATGQAKSWRWENRQSQDDIVAWKLDLGDPDAEAS